MILFMLISIFFEKKKKKPHYALPRRATPDTDTKYHIQQSENQWHELRRVSMGPAHEKLCCVF